VSSARGVEIQPGHPPTGARTAGWTRVLDDVWLFRDSCNVYAVHGPDGMLIVDAGTGAWIDALDELPAEPAALACTHYLRDHSAGAARASERGIPVYVPEGERAIFTDPDEHFRMRPTYDRYDNVWDHFAPLRAVSVAGALLDEARMRLAGLDVDVVPLPGATVTQVGLMMTSRTGARLALCGETIHSPGRVARIAPLQYGYAELPGVPNVITSARDLRRRGVDVLLPSLGEPILTDCDGALAALERNLRRLGTGRTDEEWGLLDEPPLRQIGERVWQTASANAVSTFVLGPSGRAMIVDLGFDPLAAGLPAHWARTHLRRASLRPVREFLALTGADRIDVAFASHYHDDHVGGLPLLQRVYGTQVWCPDWFADLLAHPERYAFPCLWPQPARIDRELAAGEAVTWDDVDVRAHPMSGHTRFSAAIVFTVAGVRYLHSGDQYLSREAFLRRWPVPAGYTPDWTTDRLASSYVYRNGLTLSSYRESAEIVRRERPDVLLCGHHPAFAVDEAFLEAIDRHAGEFEAAHRAAMALDDNSPHFGADSWGGWIVPYRTVLAEPGEMRAIAHVRNPLPEPAELTVRLVGPDGWAGPWASATAPGRAEAAIDVTMDLPAPCRSRPVAVELVAGGRTFGQVAEALVTVHSRRR
jgi:glyoxylase-like metal-dependent hydrolase (beta-lactamase superfamily II)